MPIDPYDEAALNVAGTKAPAAPPVPSSAPNLESLILGKKPSDPYEAAATDVAQGGAATIRSNLLSAQGTNPAAEGRAQQLSAQSGVPIESVRANPDVVASRIANDKLDAEALQKNFPHTAQFLQDPSNARVVAQDIPATAAVEQAVKALPPPSPAQQEPVMDSGMGFGGSFDRRVSNWLNSGGDDWRDFANIPVAVMNSALSLIHTGVMAAYGVTQASKSSESNPQAQLRNDIFGPSISGVASSLLAKGGDYLLPDFITKLEHLQQQGEDVTAKDTFGAKAATYTGNLIAMMGEAGPMMAKGAASPVFTEADTAYKALVNMLASGAKGGVIPAVVGGSETFQKVYDETGSEAQALAAYAVSTATSLAQFSVPLGMGGNAAKRAVAVPLSVLATNELSRRANNAVLPEGMQQPFSAEDAALNVLSMMVMHVAMGPTTSYTSAIKEQVKAVRAYQDLQGLHTLDAASQASTLRDNNPQAFHDFVDGMSDGKVSDVYVGAEALQQALARNPGESAALFQKVPELQDQLNEALRTKGDVRIPLADYATHVAGTTIGDTLKSELKTSPEGMTYAQAQVYQQNQVKEMQGQAERLVAERTKTKAESDATDAVYQNVLNQLTEANHFSPDVNKVYAKLTAAGYAARASQLGIHADEMFKQFPVDIQSVFGPARAEGAPRDIGTTVYNSDKAIQDRFAAQLKDYGVAKAAYNAHPDTDGGRVISTDIARELSSDYLKDRSRSAAVHEPASAFVKRLYADKLAEKPGQNVLFTAGGTGSGKTTALKALPGLRDEAKGADIIYDTNSNTFESAKNKIQQALDAGANVHLAMVVRHPVDAFVNGALKRAMSQEAKFGSGRAISIDNHLATHIGAMETLPKLVKHFKDNPHVKFTVVDNSHGKGNARELALDNLPKQDYNNIKPQLEAALDKEYQDGKISERVYTGFKNANRAIEEGTGVHGLAAGENAGGQPEQKRTGAGGAEPALAANSKPATAGVEKPLLNIGLDTNDGRGVTPEEVRAEIEKLGVKVVDSRVHKSDTEDTLVAQLDRELTPKELHDLSVSTRQEAVPQYANGKGILEGPAKEKWGEFNPDYFLKIDGTRLGSAYGQHPHSSSLTPEQNALLDAEERALEKGKGLASVERNLALADKSAPSPGKPFIVYRLGSDTAKGLKNANGADAEGVAAFLTAAQDHDSSVSSKGTTVHAYEVTTKEPFGDYRTYRGGKANGDAKVGMMNKWGGHWLSFPEGADFTEKHIASFKLEDLHKELQKAGYKNFDEAGGAAGGAAVRKLMADKFGEGYGQKVGVDKTIYWHGSASGDLRGGRTGLHLGSKQAATEALEARIGVPAVGSWDGTREYGKTLLAGRKTLRIREKAEGRSLVSGKNVDAPEEDYYPSQAKQQETYANGDVVPLDVRPSVRPYVLNTEMSNTRSNPHGDFKANGYMAAGLKKGNAKRGFYYNNVGEGPPGEISVVVPNGKHILKPGEGTITGIHYSNAPREFLSGEKYGTGIKGAEAKRLAQSEDSRIKSRVSFYIDEGRGTFPEAGLGRVRHEAQLDNMYNAAENPLRIPADDLNKFESGVLDHGFKGYYVPEAFGRQGAAVVLGDAAKNIKAEVKNHYGQAMTAEESNAYFDHLDGRDRLSPEEWDKIAARVEQAHTGPASWIEHSAGDPLYNRALYEAREQGSTNASNLMRSLGVSRARAERLVDRMEAEGYVEKAVPAEGSKVQHTPGYATEDVTRKFQSAPGQYHTTDKIHTADVYGQGGELRGSYAPSVNQLSLLNKADLSTFPHELGHHFLEMTSDLASRPDAPQSIRDDMDKLLNWFGVKGDTPEQRLTAWSTAHDKAPEHEKFAESFERYLLEGKAPSMELQPVFARVRSWMLDVYETIQGLLASRPAAEQLTPEVRQVFDRMLASEDAIAQAEHTRGYAPLFKSAEEAGMSPEKYQAYLDLGNNATQQAIDDMTKRSGRDMQLLSGAKSRALKALQAEADAKRDAIRTEVEKEVEQQPVYRAERWLKKGELIDDKGEVTTKVSDEAKGGAKLNTNAVRELFPEGMPEALHGMTSPDGLHPDLAAEMLGFNSGGSLVQSLADRQPKQQVIDGMVDQRMLERHGELSDPQSIDRAANEAVANKGRQLFLATGLKILTKSPVPAKQLAAAAKEAATNTINGKVIRDLRPLQYEAQESRANKEALKNAAKDPQGAIKAQRAALLNNTLAKAATQAVNDVQKGIDYVKRFDKKSIMDKMDVDVRDQVNDLLDRFDFRKNPSTVPTRAETNLQNWVKAQIDAGYSPVLTPDMLNPAFKTHYKDMTVEQFRGLIDGLKAIEHIGQERKSVNVRGRKESLDDLVHNELVPKMQERPNKFTTSDIIDTPEERHTNSIAVALDHLNSWRRGVMSDLKMQEYKRNQYDSHELLGPFGESIFEPVFRADYRKGDLIAGLSKDFEATANSLGREWQDSLLKSVDNKTLIDPDKTTEAGEKVYMAMTRAKMLGTALHVGNESNFDKLTKGWGWDPADVMRFLHDNMTKKDWDAVQSVWDLNEKHAPEIFEMNHNLGNTNPDKIEPRAFQTQFGTYKGGYARIEYDALRSRRGEKAAAGQAINPSTGLFGADYYRDDRTTNGSLNARQANYIDRVSLDYHYHGRALNESMHDLAFRETLVDVNKIIDHPDFRKQFRLSYGPEAYTSLKEWLGNLANSDVVDHNLRGFQKALAYARTGVVINGIGFRISTVLKHGGSAGIKTLGYFPGLSKRYFLSRAAQMGTSPGEQIRGAIEKFPEIRARLRQQDRDYKDMVNTLFEPEGKMAMAHRFGHAAVAWSDMMTAVPTAWGAYDRAITEGIPVDQGGTGKPMTEEQAVAYASKTVREAHGTNIQAGRSNVVNSHNEAVKMFTTLYGFMNNTLGQAGNMIDQLKTPGYGKPEALAKGFTAVLIPALWAGYLTQGNPEDDKKGVGHWMARAIAGETAGMVPLVRDAYNFVEGYKNAGLVGVESWLSTMTKPFTDAYKVWEGQNNDTAIRDTADALGVGLHIPGLGQLGASAQYLENVRTGKEHPQNTSDIAEGLIKGHGEKK